MANLFWWVILIEPGELCYGFFLFQLTLLRRLIFLLGSQTVTLIVLLFWNFFFFFLTRSSHWRCSVKKVFLKISQYLQENRRIISPYGVSLHIQSECGKMLTRITPNLDTFYAVNLQIQKLTSQI